MQRQSASVVFDNDTIPPSYIVNRDISSSTNRKTIVDEIYDRRVFNLKILQNLLDTTRTFGNVQAITISQGRVVCGCSSGHVDVINTGDGAVVDAYSELQSDVLDEPQIVNDMQCHHYEPNLLITASGASRISVSGIQERKIFQSTSTMKPAIQIHWNEVNISNAALAYATMENHASVIDLRFMDMKKAFRWEKAPVCCVQWWPTRENILAIGDLDGRVAFFDTRSSKGVLNWVKVADRPVSSIRFTADGTQFVTTDESRMIKLWNTAGLKFVRSHQLSNSGSFETNVMNPSLKVSLTDSGSFIHIAVPNSMNVSVASFPRNGGPVREFQLRGHFKKVFACAFIPGKQQLISAGADRALLWWVPSSDRAASLLTKGEIEATERAINDNWSDEDS